MRVQGGREGGRKGGREEGRGREGGRGSDGQVDKIVNGESETSREMKGRRW